MSRQILSRFESDKKICSSTTKNLQFYDKKFVSVWQPYGIDPNMMLLKDKNFKELSHSDSFVFCFVLFSLLA